MQPRTYYDVLGVDPRATTQEIRLAYRALARVLHPDAMAELAEALSVLTDPPARRAYDRHLVASGEMARSMLVRWVEDPPLPTKARALLYLALVAAIGVLSMMLAYEHEERRIAPASTERVATTTTTSSCQWQTMLRLTC